MNKKIQLYKLTKFKKYYYLFKKLYFPKILIIKNLLLKSYYLIKKSKIIKINLYKTIIKNNKNKNSNLLFNYKTNKIKSHLNYNVLNFHNFFNLTFEKFFNKKFIFQLNPNIIKKLTNNIYYDIKSLLRIYNYLEQRLNTSIFLNEFFYALCLTLQYKKIDLFLNFFIKILKKVDISKQFVFLYFMTNLLKNEIIGRWFKIYGIKGLYISIKGKINTGGNARTRTYYLKKNKYSKSTLKNKFSSKYKQIITISGVLGIKILLTY